METKNNDFIKFVPVRGTQAKIDKTKPTDGYVYFATDTGRIYMDKGQSRYSMGGSGGGGTGGAGAAIYYVETPSSLVPEADETYLVSKDYMSPSDKPIKYDILLNVTDGSFFRVIQEEEEWYVCERLSVSGGSSGPIIAGPELELKPAPASVINGQDYNVTFTVRSLLNDSGNPRDTELNVTYRLVDKATDTEYFTDTRKVAHGVETTINLGSQLRHSATTECFMYAKGINSGQSDTKSFDVTTSQMELSHTDFSNISVFDADSLDFTFNTIGALDKLFVLTYDKGLPTEFTHTKKLGSGDSSYSIHIPENHPETGVKCASHGYHSITVDLYQDLGNGELGFKYEPSLAFEIAVKDPAVDLPIIWLGEYKNTYYAYDDIQIPFMVYDPSSASSVKVEFFNAGTNIGEREIKDFSKFDIFEIVDATMEYTNNYSIATGIGERRQQREIGFEVVPDPVRTMTPVKSTYMMLGFEAKGRSNNDPLSKRTSWTNTITSPPEMSGVTATLENFNWYNNGWMMDNNKQSMLRISNGAQVRFPIGNLTFANPQAANQQSYTFEFQFKISNVQDYSNLIKNITRYKNDDDKTHSLGSWWDAFSDPDKNIWGHTNYDAFLKDFLPPEIYDKLEIDYVYKQMNLNNVICKYYSQLASGARGLALGAQDAFFSDGSNTVSVNFVEDEMINLSFVYKHSTEEGIDSLIYVYINGVITGVIKSKASQAFSIGSNELVFYSNSCDIDLYRMRIYKTALDVKDICMNYAVDRKSIDIYDQNGLALPNKLTGEYQFDYNSMLQYNLNHPNDMLMPYIVIDTSNSNNDDKLPHSKATPITVDFTFVNTMLDRAYANGELLALATKDGLVGRFGKVEGVKEYYRHHCPSFTSKKVDLEVQGTSSEFYPRRNYKLKTKMKVGKKPDGKDIKKVQVYLNKGPFAEEYKEYENQVKEGTVEIGKEPSRQDGWYMDNYTNSTDRWTLKVDYMESSGSYNAGFASLIGTAYSKHPLQDYIDKGAINNIVDGEDVLVSELTGEMRWEDYRTSLLGFPVMAFHKKSEDNSDVVFIGYYRMLLDKGSDDVLGFDTGDAEQTILGETASDTTECWEFSTNARTFCSYKDPWNRVELSFKSLSTIGDEGFIQLENNKRGGPVVLQHFEPRYVANEDYLKNDEDGFYNFGSLNQATVTEMCNELGIPVIDVTADDALYKAQDGAVYMMRNWEAACKWIYSTYLDNVVSQAKNYTANPFVGIEMYSAGKFYVYNVGAEERGEDEYIISNAAYDANTTYYNKKTENGKTVYVNAFVVNDEKNVYKPNRFYVEVGGAYSLDRRTTFTEGEIYYEQELLTDEQIAEIADLLVAKATTYDADAEYYTYNPEAIVPTGGGKSNAATYVGKLDEATFNSGNYYVASPVTYINTTYKYDTKEYRTAKFINELDKHFDIEYLATYFIATEVFECYDSRGKNCMMASWGPQEEGGEYIWYPIFYDIDTQLGINNTGIPSFEFNVDASDAGNYSTSDSVLWNNFYRFFKGSSILNKYQQMKNIKQSSFNTLTNPPLKSVDNLEGWYTFDPDVTKMISCRGHRPLIATNLDAYYKYITITNPKGISTGITGYLDRQGNYTTDTDGKYFYALQGDRSQSRRQFLTSRLEYIDSWLNQGNYARGGENCIRGRISANDATKTSDKWLESTDGYWVDNQEYGTKKYPFDAEYWVNLTPIRSSYVTLSDDSKAYTARKYDGITPVQFEITEVKNGVRNSANYPEQLLYIYGMNQMSDVGSMHNLYWREFYIDGEAPKLTKLNLGYDAKVSYVDKDGNTQETTWYNNKLNKPSIPSAKAIGSKGMPLLKEVNLSNIQIQAGSAEATMDFTSCEKLENFRATGSTLTDIRFAEGVALHTLYVPNTLATLDLVEANLLTKLIDKYEFPTVQADGSLLAKRGLYIDKLFDKSSSLNTINLIGGGLGYHSHSLLRAFYAQQEKAGSGGNITMTKVNWSPYVKVNEGEEYDSKATYVCDNGHFGFKPYVHNNIDDFNVQVASGNIYRESFYIKVENVDDYDAEYSYYTYDEENNTYTAYAYVDESTFKAQVRTGLYYYNHLIETVDDTTVAMLRKFAQANNGYLSASNAAVPEISGIIYINNTTKYDECEVIQKELQTAYPNLSFFFANEIEKAYSARFVLVDAVTGAEKMVAYKDGTIGPSVQKIGATDVTTKFFTSPYSLYNVEQDHWDFYGWSATKPDLSTDAGIQAAKSSVISESEWEALDLRNNDLPAEDNKMTYTFYAILTKHQYDYKFVDICDNNYTPEPLKVTWGTAPTALQIDQIMMPYNDSVSDLYKHYKFKGWVLNDKSAGLYDSADYTLVDPTKYIASKDLTFYAVFLKEDVTASVLDAKYFNFYKTTYNDAKDSSYSRNGDCYAISLKKEYADTLRGKVTFPTATPKNAKTVDGETIAEGKPIISLFSGEKAATGVTHVFFDPTHDNEIRIINAEVFRDWSNMRYIDFVAMTNLRMIGTYAFAYTNFDNLRTYDPLVSIEDNAFTGSGNRDATAVNITLNSMLQYLGERAIANGFSHGVITIGTEDKPSELNQMGWSGAKEAIYQSNRYASPSITVYTTLANQPMWNGWLYGTSGVDLLISSTSGAQINIVANN